MTGAGDSPADAGPVVCNVAGCGCLAAYQLGARLFAATDSKRERRPYELRFALVVCQGHKDKPAHTCPEFFDDVQRRYINEKLRPLGHDLPNYSTAEWLFMPLQKPAAEVKH